MMVTELALGGVGIGGMHGPLPEEEAAGAVRRAIELGINYVDTSPLYLESEARIGRAFRQMGGKPDHVYLSTKTGTHPQRRGDYTAAGTRWSVENSMRLLGVDSLDLVLVHDPRSEAELGQALGPGGAVDELERMKTEGKVRAVGLGVREHHYHRRAIHSGRVDAILTYADYNLIRQTAGPLIDAAHAAGVGVILAQIVLSGLLAGGDPAQLQRLHGRPDYAEGLDWWRWAQERGVDLLAVAIQFGLRNPKIGCIPIGAQRASEVEQNVAAAAKPIDESIWQEVAQRISTGAGQAKG
jgi:aryl-alcohol dehydrogenase-like predicted oxidoreductase